jgi:hypothetical protein
MEPEPESRWLFWTLAGLLFATTFLLFSVSVVLSWPLAKVGNGFQLLGVTIAALGVPVIPPFLGRVESAIEHGVAVARRWLAHRRAALQAWWDRLRRRTRVVAASGGVTTGGAVSGSVTTERGKVDRETISERDWLAFLNDEIDALWVSLRQLRKDRAADWEEFERRLATEGEDLRAHTIAVTRRGWQFILAGVACSWFGTLLALLA